MQSSINASFENPAEDVFLSYVHEDRAIAEKVVERLKKRGRTVFWDIDIRTGEHWLEKLEAKASSVRCVVVLWSEKSVKSHWVLEEAMFGDSRGVYLGASLDSVRPPLGFARLHVADLSGWAGDAAPSGFADLAIRIDEFVKEVHTSVDREARDNEIRLEQKRTKTEHISVSKQEVDRDAIISRLADQPEYVLSSIYNGYSELSSAQHSARYTLDDHAPGRFYASAADHFAEALREMGSARNREARHGRSIEYFLSMERANSLTFSEQGINDQIVPRQEAINIYTRLSREPQYAKDAPVHFRLGGALSRLSRAEDTIMKAIRALGKARVLADEAQKESSDLILSEGQWLYAEIAKQLGACNYHLSVLPGVTSRRAEKYLNDAIQDTREALSFELSSEDSEGLIGFTVLKARGNLIFLLSKRIREGFGSDKDHKEIEDIISVLRQPESWQVAVNQVRIIDNIAYAASTIGDWQTALDESERNIDNFKSLAMPNGLSPEDTAREARAREIQFFARKFLAKN